MFRWPTKDPDAKKDFSVDWTSWLDGDTILTSVFTVPTGITKESETNSSISGTVWLSGGTPGRTYAINHRITTAGGRIDDRTVEIRVGEI